MFKMRVTPKQSKVVQEALKMRLRRDMWVILPHYLYLEDCLFVGYLEKEFTQDHLKEITFNEFCGDDTLD